MNNILLATFLELTLGSYHTNDGYNNFNPGIGLGIQAEYNNFILGGSAGAYYNSFKEGTAYAKSSLSYNFKYEDKFSIEPTLNYWCTYGYRDKYGDRTTKCDSFGSVKLVKNEYFFSFGGITNNTYFFQIGKYF